MICAVALTRIEASARAGIAAVAFVRGETPVCPETSVPVWARSVFVSAVSDLAQRLVALNGTLTYS